ncbi:MFS transporter [Aquabacterium olei]|uniref:MFS transporter n=1 Tax=Aquabacterium olei TaxID=1296669 RepID=A0A2U8FMM7_9BURK|nr:MFS transporter [Aquabacterium olei]AWI52158.1 MFS transporter [Aquabacterium olei]
MWFRPSPLPRDTRLVALIVASAFFMQTLDSAILTTSLPQMAQTFGVRPVEMSAAITVYLLCNAALIPVAAWLAERFGARVVLGGAIALFTLASVGCALAPGVGSFLVARAVQGGAGALMMPVGRMVVLRQAEKRHLLEATALITWPGLIGPVIGPVLGGAITAWLDWRWNFWINLPIGLVGVWLVRRHIPDVRAREPGAFDHRGALLTGAALVCVMLGLEVASQQQLPWAWTLALIAVGLAIGAVALRHLQRHPRPLLNLAVFRVPTFALCSLSAGTCSRVAIAATPFLLPLLFQVGFGWSAAASGSLVMAYFAGNLAMKSVTTPVLRRFGFRPVLVANGVALGASVMACSLLGPDTPLWLLLPLLVLAGLTRSMQFTSLNTLSFADLEDRLRGTAATISSMLHPINAMLGTALAAGLLNLAMAASDRTTLALADFRWAFLLCGGLGVAGGLAYLRLHPQAGHEVSGRGAPA